MKKTFTVDKVFYQKLFRIALPVMFQNLMLASVAAGDALMLGRLDQNSMAAVSLATQIQFVQNILVGAFVAALTILGAQYWGKEDKATITDLTNMTMRLSVGLSALFFLGCVLFPETLMKLFAGDPELIRIGAGYLRIAGWSYLLTGISQVYLGNMKVTDHVTRSAWISSGAVVLNILFNAIFIFGLFGIPAMGARGAALATLLARAIELAWAVISSFGKDYVRPDLAGILGLRKTAKGQAAAVKSATEKSAGVQATAGDVRTGSLWGDFCRCMLPLLGASALWGIGFTSYTAVMGHLGTDAAAANSVSAVVRDLMCCLSNGVAAAAEIMVGNELGSGHLERGKEYGIRLSRLSIVLGIFSMIVILLVTWPVVHFMILTDEARKLLVGMMIIMAVYMIGRTVNTVVINGVFGAGGDTLFDMYSLAVMMWGIAVPLAFLGAFVFHWPVLVCYACTCVDEVGKFPWVYAHFKKYKWVRDLTR